MRTLIYLIIAMYVSARVPAVFNWLVKPAASVLNDKITKISLLRIPYRPDGHRIHTLQQQEILANHSKNLPLLTDAAKLIAEVRKYSFKCFESDFDPASFRLSCAVEYYSLWYGLCLSDLGRGHLLEKNSNK
jgi:hypothetical protein